MNRAHVLRVYTAARRCIEGPAHVDAAQGALQWISCGKDAEEVDFRYGCVMAAAEFRTGVMDAARFAACYQDVHDVVGELHRSAAPREGRKKATRRSHGTSS